MSRRSGPGLHLALGLGAVAPGCSWAFLGGRDAPEPAPPPDLTAPVLTIRPPGGAYGAVQYVTLATGEPATVRYTLDGSDPALAGSAVVAAPSPVFWLRMGPPRPATLAVALCGRPGAGPREREGHHHGRDGWLPWWDLAPTPDGVHLIGGRELLHVFRASDLSPRGWRALGLPPGWQLVGLVPAPDGTRLYGHAFRSVYGTFRVVRIPLR